MLADQGPDRLGVQRTRVKHHSDARERREAKSASESEGVKERKDAENAVAFVKVKNLFELLDVGGQIEVREDDALGFAGRATRENNRGGVVERSGAPDAEKLLKQAGGK